MVCDMSVIMCAPLSRSWVLVPFAHWGAWYYLIDLYTMYEAHRLRRHAPYTRTRTMCSFVKRRWSILTHHLLLLCVAYPLAVVSYTL